MTIEQAEAIVSSLRAEFPQEAEYVSARDNYVGRGMVNKPTVAITVDSTGVAILVGYIAAQLDIPAKDLPKRTDQLGLGLVLY